MNRRLFVLSSSAAALAACSSSSPALPTAPTFVRQEVTEFAANPALVKAFRDGVRAMMAFPDITDPRSWQYWHNSHWMATGMPPASMASVWNQCPHRKPYFYAWHRAFLFFFEAVLRSMSGNANFALPYWDYYKHPQLPDIFAQPVLTDGTPNPLYWPVRDNVRRLWRSARRRAGDADDAVQAALAARLSRGRARLTPRLPRPR